MDNTLLTYDVFWMALIKAFCNKEPDRYRIIKVREFKEKVQAVYLDKDGLPFLSQARILFGDREISMNDFRFAYFDMKDKIHLVLKEKSEGTDDSQEMTDNRIREKVEDGKRKETATDRPVEGGDEEQDQVRAV